MTFANISPNTWIELWKKVQPYAEKSENVEQIAQKFIDVIYEEFEESLALARLFISVPYDELSTFNQNFVKNLARQLNIESALTNTTPVLSLLGTRGNEPEWNDCRQSKGHLGIPLVSPEFVDTIPMVSRLLNQLGLGLDWIGMPAEKLSLQTKSASDVTGTFLVQDAKNDLDSKNRRIIPMQDFVADYNIKTVFGFGGRYLVGNQSVIAAILFSKESLTVDTPKKLSPIIRSFKVSTMRLLKKEKIFSL
ncbi:hypothetical protein THIOM_004788 [Candidatus Thiomargarita nelsonii]|uniref:Uncharacterized protein n=1 Tax=Candidatus Thiomargarita nelsonii TaxID=1003181 RepID=A0A176RV03_9GAMM|nr:hypothetical protein THIOM_004788 [Candidatus Thiomargarita nelsonii]